MSEKRDNIYRKAKEFAEYYRNKNIYSITISDIVEYVFDAFIKGAFSYEAKEYHVEGMYCFDSLANMYMDKYNKDREWENQIDFQKAKQHVKMLFEFDTKKLEIDHSADKKDLDSLALDFANKILEDSMIRDELTILAKRSFIQGYLKREELKD